MYFISNRDMEQAIEFIELMIEYLPDKGLRFHNKKRMAKILVRKWRAKQPFSMSDLTDEMKRFINQK